MLHPVGGMTTSPKEADGHPEAGRVPILDPLRGLAALAVMWFHVTNGSNLLDGGGAGAEILKASGRFGWTGVEFFFVISGFVLPHALQRGGYRLRNYGTFLAKRLIRLEPPYLVSLALALALGYASSHAPGFRGEPFRFEVPRILLHLGYLNTHFGYPSYNPVYWTLGIELQFYLGLALIFPALVARSATARSLAFLALAGASVLPGREDLIPRYLPLFLAGILTFQHTARLVGRCAWLAGLALCSTLCLRSMPAPAAVAGACAALAIGLAERLRIPASGWKGRLWQALTWTGTVSYSLYLLHVLVGGRAINLAQRLQLGLPGQCLALLSASTLSLAAAWALHRWVEAPSQRLSAGLSFRTGKH